MTDKIIEEVEVYKSEYTEKEWSIAKSLLTNSYNQVNGMYDIASITNAYPSFKLDFVLRITNATIKKLIFLSNIVGIQSMNGPVGLVYYLDRYSKPSAFEIKATAVEARSKKMKAGWSMEAVQDAKTIHGQSVDALLEDALAQEIVVEYVSTILEPLRKAAFRTLNVDSEHTPVKKIIKRIKLESSYIENKVGSKKGNYVILSIKNFKLLFPNHELEQCYIGILDSGKVIDNDGTDIKVYVSDFMEDDVLVGLNDTMSSVDVGFVLCPYVLLMCNIVNNASTMEPYMSIMTRFGMECTKERSERYYTVFRMGERVATPEIDRMFENEDIYKLI